MKRVFHFVNTYAIGTTKPTMMLCIKENALRFSKLSLFFTPFDIIPVITLGRVSITGRRLLIISIARVKCEIAIFSKKFILTKKIKFKNDTYKILSK